METSIPKAANSSMDFDPLIKKINNDDPDIRFMVLGDLQNMLASSMPTILRTDLKRSSQLTDAITERLDDSNGDVQSQALKAVAPLAAKLSDSSVKTFLEKLAITKTKNSLDDAIFITAIRTVVTNLPRPNMTSTSRQVADSLDILAHSVLPRLAEGLLEPTANGGTKPESIELAHEVIICYGMSLPEKDKRQLLKKLVGLLDDDRATIVVQKRAVSAIAALSVYLSDSLFRGELVSGIVQRFKNAELATRKMRMLLLLVGSVAQASNSRLDASLPQLVPFVFKVASRESYDSLTDEAQEEGANVQGEETVEAALTALDELLSSCGPAMRDFTDKTIASSILFLTYDPNLIEDEDQAVMDEDDAFDADDNDDDFEEEAGMSDSDDVSWKVRRSAAKVSHTLIRTRAGTDLLQNGVLYDRVAPTLVKRLSEREESVRLEVIAALARLIKFTGDIAGPVQESAMASGSDKASSRKRRRSSAATFPVKHQNLDRGASSPRETPSPTHGPQADLESLAPRIAQAVLGVMTQKHLTSQQAAASMIKDLVIARHGRLGSYLEPVIGSAVRIASTTSTTQTGSSAVPAGTAGAATGATLRIESYRLLSAICDSHSSKALANQISDITKAAVAAIDDSHFKISSEAVLTVESVIKVLTPPRSLGTTPRAKENLPQIFEVLVKQIQNQSAELEVRTTAIHALGFLLARVSGQDQLLGAEDRLQATTILDERLKNEVTRLSAIEAIDCVASAAISKSDYPEKWLQSITVELANQLRKADRTLSTTSLHTLNSLLAHNVVVDSIDSQTSKLLLQLFLPVLNSQAANQLPLVLGCVTRLVKSDGNSIIDEELIKSVTQLAQTNLSGQILEAYLELIEGLGITDAGDVLLGHLLKDVGVNGPIEVNGAAIGTIMASGEERLGVKYSDIINELQATSDSKRKALALTILGQYGFCKGKSSPLEPDAFLQKLNDKADVARAAAIALGRVGAGDPQKYFPIILMSLRKAGDKQAILLPALREVLSHKSQAASEASSHADELWKVLLQASESEDSRVVAAECVGKLTTMLPEKFIPLLQQQLQSTSAEARSLVNQAFKYALADPERQMDEALRPVVGDILSTLLRDEAMDNRRLALMTLSAAIVNKPALVAPYIPQLSRVVMERARIDTSLIHEVAMGPFKHKVDDGLEVRKSAYETLHTLINAAYPRLDSVDVFDRVIQGLGDDNDIKALCTLLVVKLTKIDRHQSSRHLHQYASMFTVTLSTKLKETAVKQEIERAQEANKDVFRATARIGRIFPTSASAEIDQMVWSSWSAYMSSLRKDHALALAQAEAEIAAEN